MMKDIEIKISRETRMVDLSKTTIGNDGENLQGNLVFSFTDDFVKGQGRLEYVINGESKYAFLLSDDENYYIPIKSVMTKEGQIDMQLVITEGTDVNEIPIFKSNVFYVSCKKSINAEVEEEEEYYSWIEIANTKLNEVDEAIEEMATQSNYAKEQGDYAKSEGDNAKSVAEETERKAQEGAFDGKSLEFVWEGTKLGVRLEGQEEYHFVDLQGKQGEIGATGEPFKIKKTYGSVSEMNSDFGNMQFGDYVMIASSVNEEDNAKLYTKGESAWIFISDFSGAMGIRGETGLTPNIQIGEVKTLEPGSQAKVTRSGSNEEPVFNFELPKGDKGDDYVLTEEDKIEIGEKVNTEYEKRIEENEKDIADLEATIDILTNTDTKKGELVHITDALPLPTFETTADGNVKQETTKGNQLFDISTVRNYGITPNTGEIWFNDWWKLSDYIKIEENTPFTFSWVSNSTYFQVQGCYYDENKTYISGFNMSKDGVYSGTETTPIGTKYLRIAYSVNVSGNEVTRENIMLNLGTTTLPWEKFTNGASPNPEYPQDIEVLEGYNLFNSFIATKQEYQPGEIQIEKDGSIILSGNTGSNNYFGLEQTLGEICPDLKVGDIVYLNNNTTSSIARIYVGENWFNNEPKTITQTLLDKKVIIYGGYNQVDKLKIQILKEPNKPYLPYGCVGYKVNGKNLVKSKYVGNTTDNYAKVLYANFDIKPNTTYTISFNGTNGNKVYINEKIFTNYQNVAIGNTRVTITATTKSEIPSSEYENYRNGWALLKNQEGNTNANVFDDLQIELGDKATEIEPYKEQIVPLDLKSNWVGAINDNIKDYLVTDKKKYWLVKNVGKVVLDGSENWKQSSVNSTVHNILVNNFKAPITSNIIVTNLVSSHFKTGATYNQLTNKDEYYNIVSATSDSYISFKYKETTSIASWKTWLSENNVELYYELLEPQIIELGELPEPIKTFEGVNNIQLLANLDTEIEVTYALDVKKYFENKLASIQEQIL